MRQLPLALVALTLWSAACASRDPSAPAPSGAPPEEQAAAPDLQADAAAAIIARLDAYQQVEGRLQTEAGDARFVAYFDDGELRYLAERIDLGPQSSTISEYYFENGRLFHYTANKRAALVEAAAVEAITTRLSFDPDGVLVRAERTVDGAPVEVADDEVLAVRLHVQFLSLAAIEARGQLRRAGNRSS